MKFVLTIPRNAQPRERALAPATSIRNRGLNFRGDGAYKQPRSTRFEPAVHRTLIQSRRRSRKLLFTPDGASEQRIGPLDAVRIHTLATGSPTHLHFAIAKLSFGAATRLPFLSQPFKYRAASRRVRVTLFAVSDGFCNRPHLASSSQHVVRSWHRGLPSSEHAHAMAEAACQPRLPGRKRN